MSQPDGSDSGREGAKTKIVVVAPAESQAIIKRDHVATSPSLTKTRPSWSGRGGCGDDIDGNIFLDFRYRSVKAALKIARVLREYYELVGGPKTGLYQSA